MFSFEAISNSKEENKKNTYSQSYTAMERAGKQEKHRSGKGGGAGINCANMEKI